MEYHPRAQQYPASAVKNKKNKNKKKLVHGVPSQSTTVPGERRQKAK
jgi:hypothetical protein